MLANKATDDSSAFHWSAPGRVNDDIVFPAKSRVIDLFACHSSLSVVAEALPLFKNVQWGPYTHQAHRPAGENTKASLQFRLIAEHEVNDDLKLRLHKADERRP